MRLIDADALKADYFTTTPTTGTISTMYVSLYQILNAPTIEERKTGKWIKMDTWLTKTGDGLKCSNCRHACFGGRYCSNCGAIMEGEEHGIIG